MVIIPLIRMTVVDRCRQPVTWLVTAVSLALLGMSFLFGQFNFELQDRLRMLTTTGVAVAIANGLFLAVLGASQTVYDELTSRTALTLFAKPLGRGSYLLGKALGIWLTVVLSGFVILAAHAGLLWLALTYGFELDTPNRSSTSDLWLPWAVVFMAHALAAAHGLVLTCLATVLALRVPLIANILLCFAIFCVGHLITGAGLMGAGLIPALEIFNLDDSLQFQDRIVSGSYLLMTGLYTGLYCGGCILAGLALFRRQDIA